jgi:hypothetical protein
LIIREAIIAYTMSVGKPEGKRTFERPVRENYVNKRQLK